MTGNLALLNRVKHSVASGSIGQPERMLRHMTDLFIVGAAQYSKEELLLFDEVFGRLVVEIELSARALLAVRLAPIRNAPPNIIRTLAFDDEIDVAGPVLAESERLDEATLVENARQKSQAHLLAISRRRGLGVAVTDVLVERGDRQVLLSTAENPGARFSDSGFDILVRKSDGDDRLAACVGSRPEIPPHLFLRLLAKASQSVRAKLEAAHPNARHEVRQAVAEVAGRVRADALDRSARHLAARALVEKLHRTGQLDDGRLAEIAEAGKFEETTVALALMAELPLPFVEGAMIHERSETVVILARAIGLSWSTAKAILLLRAGQRPLPPGEVAKCLASFERLKPATAQEIVRFYRTRARGGTKRPL